MCLVILANRDSQENVCSQTSVSTYTQWISIIIFIMSNNADVLYLLKLVEVMWITMSMTPSICVPFKMHFVYHDLHLCNLFGRVRK